MLHHLRVPEMFLFDFRGSFWHSELAERTKLE